MANTLTVDPSQVQTISVDPSEVQHVIGSQGFLSDVGDTLKQYWNKINPVTAAQGLAQAATHPVDAVNGYRGQNEALYQKSLDAFHKGDYAEGARHALSYFLNGIPGVGAALDEAGNKAGNGDYKGAIADTAALATQLVGMKYGPKILDAATEPGAISEPIKAAAALPGKAIAAVKEAAMKPGTVPIVTGAGQIVGAPAALASGHPIVAGGLAVRGIQNIQKGLALRAAEGEAVPPLYDQIVQGMGGTKYSLLDEAQQATIRKIAENIQNPPPLVVPRPRPPLVLTPEEMAPGKGIQQILAEELDARRAAAPPPDPMAIDPKAILQTWRAEKGAPLGPPDVAPTQAPVTPAAAPPAAQVAPPPTAPVETPAPVAAAPEAPTASANPVPEAYRAPDTTGLQIPKVQSARDAIATKLANHIHKAGITSDDLDALATNEAAHKLFWDNAGQIPGLSKQTNYTPSAETIDAARAKLMELEGKSTPAAPKPAAVTEVPAALANNPKALKAARALQKEMLKPVTIGDLMSKGATQ